MEKEIKETIDKLRRLWLEHYNLAEDDDVSAYDSVYQQGFADGVEKSLAIVKTLIDNGFGA